VRTRLDGMEVAIPEVRREMEYYPSALEPGVRRERALKLVVTEMYAQGAY
jgi:putative transposase